MSGSNFLINQSLLFVTAAATDCLTTIVSESNNQAVAFGIIVSEEGLNIQKSLIKQPQILENNEDIVFSFKFSPATDITDDIKYVIVDTLPQGLSCNESDVTIFQKTANNKFNPIKFNLTFIDTTATITIPLENISTLSDVIVNFPVKIINKDLLPGKFTNVCSINLVNPTVQNQGKVNLSNTVDVSLPQEDDSQKPTPYLIILFLYYCCCCYCNKE